MCLGIMKMVHYVYVTWSVLWSYNRSKSVNPSIHRSYDHYVFDDDGKQYIWCVVCVCVWHPKWFIIDDNNWKKFPDFFQKRIPIEKKNLEIKHFIRQIIWMNMIIILAKIEKHFNRLAFILSICAQKK